MKIIKDIENYLGISSINTLEFNKNICPNPKILFEFGDKFIEII